MTEKKPDNKRSLKQRFQTAARKFTRHAVIAPFAASALLLSPAARADEQVPATQLAYTQQLFLQNSAIVTQKPPVNTPPAQQADYYMKELCLAAAALPPAPSADNSGTAANDNKSADDALSLGRAQVAEAVAALEKMPLTGKPLIDLAAQNKVQFCPLQHLPGGVAAQYLPDLNAVASGPVYKGGNRVLQIGHELTHAAQDQNGLLNYNNNWDIESRVQRNTAIEASAMTMEFLIAYDAKLHGDDSYWKELQTNMSFAYGDKNMYTLIDDTYKAGISAGKTPDDALRAAGFVAWQEIFKSKEWRTFYLNVELMNYLQDINSGVYNVVHDIQGGQFTQDKVDAAGKVGALPSFTAGEKMPALKDILADNQKMAWAYQAADLERHRQAWGADDKRVEAMRAQAVLDANPYLGLDMKEMYRRATDESWKQGPGKHLYFVYEVMDDALTQQNAAPAKPAAQPQPVPLDPQRALAAGGNAPPPVPTAPSSVKPDAAKGDVKPAARPGF